jgi:hypothetical protein
MMAEGTKEGTCKHRFKRGKRGIQKKTTQILVGVRYKKKGFTLVSLDESFLFYDSLIRRVRIDESKRPVVKITGSYKHECLYGAIDIERKQLFRQYDKFNIYTFPDFLKIIHKQISKMLFVYG